ncbi:MAG TPA: hypothetical protein VEF89_18690 [Solirubrobacteraceae bacterium]|nr:hypothetical protein [Solirubrobacteraceae bacterium]
MSEHDHDYDHPPITNGDEPAAAVRARALEELLVEKGVLHPEEEQLATLVTRDSMIGVAEPAAPALA